MPRAAFLGFPARGHTAPTLPVVRELARRGAEVDYHTTPAFQALVEGAGARFRPYPPGCEDLLGGPVELDELLARSLAASEAMLAPLLEALDPAPDLLLFDASALWGPILARRLARPSVASITTFALNRTLLQLLGAPGPAAWSEGALERLNAAYGPAFADHLDLLIPAAELKFVYTARAFQPAGRFFDASHLFLGPLTGERPREGVAPRIAGPRPLAYVSLGTIFNRDHGLLRQVSEVLAARGWQVVVSLGDAAAAPAGDWPEHVQAHAFVDQIGVLQQAQLFVTHGGMNSVSEALSHAVPMIVIPQGVDQHLVARQSANLGAAVAIAPGEVTADSLAAALARLDSGRAGFQAAAARLQRSLAETTPLSEAVDQALALIERGPGRG